MTRMTATTGNAHAWTSSSASLIVSLKISGQRELATEEQEDDGEHAADEATDQAFEHERAPDEPVRRADELHHLDLATTREDGEPDRVRDQDRGRDQEDHCGDEEAISMMRAVLRILSVVSLPKSTLSTLGGRGSRRLAMSSAFSAFLGLISSAHGSGFDDS